MKKNIHFYLLTLFLLTSFSGYAQTAAGSTTFIFEAFTQGTVRFKNKAPAQALLNYDMFQQQMMFRQGEHMMILQELYTIDTVIIEERKFIPQGNVFLEKIETGSGDLYVEWKLSELSKLKDGGFGLVSHGGATDAINVSLTQTTGKAGTVQNYELNYKYNNLYYLPKGKKLQKFSTVKGFIKLFPKEHAGAIQKYASDNKINIQHVNDVLSLIEFAHKIN